MINGYENEQVQMPIGVMVDIFDGARMVYYIDAINSFGVWYGGPMVHIYGAYRGTAINCFTDNTIKDAQDAVISLVEWLENRGVE